MKNKIKIGAVALIGLLMAAGLVLIGCKGPGCTGSGDCTITIAQGTSGLYVDTDSPRSSCGKTKTEELHGCKVANMNSTWYQNETMRYGTHGCDC